MTVKKYTEEEIETAQNKIADRNIRFENIEEEFQEALMNPHVESYRKGRLVYTEDFYKEMFNRTRDGLMSSVEAYRSLGFNVEALGEDRANSAGKRARQLGLQNKLNRPKPTDYNGTIPMSQMKGLSDAEMLAYLQARCMYLEVEVDVLKKKRAQQLQEKLFGSKNQKNS